MEFGITRGGEAAEELFRKITGATKPTGASVGDALLDGDKPVEIKAVGVDSSAINQVRPVKFIPLVVFHARDSQWYVIPAHRVVQHAARRTRGQHCENPFECVGFRIREVADYRISADDLQAATRRAWEEALPHGPLRNAMEDTLRASRQEADRALRAVRAYFEAGK